MIDCCHFTITRSSCRVFNSTENFVDPWQDNSYNLIFFLTNSLIEHTYIIAVPSAKHTWPMVERYWAGSTRESPTRLPPPPPLTHHSSRQVSNPFWIFFYKKFWTAYLKTKLIFLQINNFFKINLLNCLIYLNGNWITKNSKTVLFIFFPQFYRSIKRLIFSENILKIETKKKKEEEAKWITR